MTATIVLAVAAAAVGGSDLPAKLAALDPGKRIGGSSHVVSGHGARFVGSPRADFVVGLGGGQHIFGEGGSDRLAARGEGTTLDGGDGDDWLRGGPGSTLIGGGGADTLSSTAPRTIFKVAGGDRVIAAGIRGKVSCAGNASGAGIEIRRGTTVDPVCRRVGAKVALLDAAGPDSPPAGSGSAVSGDGSNASPFVAECDAPAEDPCLVSSFPERRLTGFWANEYVPAYVCPASHPWLLRESFQTAHIALGVEIREPTNPWAIGVSIGGIAETSTVVDGQMVTAASGTKTGFPNSSATNWRTSSNTYRVVLHCTSVCDRAYHFRNERAACPAGRERAARPVRADRASASTPSWAAAATSRRGSG